MFRKIANVLTTPLFSSQKNQEETPRRQPRKILARIVASAAVIYLAVAVLMLGVERYLVFVPAKYPVGDWQPTGFTFEDVFFQSADGTRLHGWYVPHEDARAYVLFAHGNGGNLTLDADEVRVLHQQLRLAVFLFDYRGYGQSEGTPSEAGVLADARAARQWLAQREDLDEEDIVLMGQSLGGAVAVDLAAADGARGLVVRNTFTSLPDVAARFYPWLPVRWLMQNRFDSASKIARYQGPLLQTHGTEDQIVPFDLGRKLFDFCPSQRKEFLRVTGGGHNDFPSQKFFTALDQFVDAL